MRLTEFNLYDKTIFIGRYLINEVDLKNNFIEIMTLEGTIFDFIEKEGNTIYISFENNNKTKINITNIKTIYQGFDYQDFLKFFNK